MPTGRACPNRAGMTDAAEPSDSAAFRAAVWFCRAAGCWWLGFRGVGSVDQQGEFAADVAFLTDLMCLAGVGEREGTRWQREPALLEQPRSLSEGLLGPLPAAAGEQHAVLLRLRVGDREHSLGAAGQFDQLW
jgi:hypothetical protein